jgi:AraC-like DNA-binding protein
MSGGQCECGWGGYLKVECAQGEHLTSMRDEHRHDCYEIYLFLGREMSQFIQDRNFTLRCHDMALIGRLVYHRTHYTVSDKNRERVLIMFDCKCLKSMGIPDADAVLDRLFSLRKVGFSSEDDRRMAEENILRLNAAFENAKTGPARLKAKFQLYELLASLLDLHERGLIASCNEELNTAEKRVAAVIRYLNENYAGDHSLEELARIFFVGRYTLCHEFRRIAGTTVLEYLNRRRLGEACRLLRQTPSSITEIAQAVGFGSSNYFNAKFKSCYGCTPSAYRKRT